jgi:hypothetical protein
MWTREAQARRACTVANSDLRIFEEKKQGTDALLCPSSLSKYALGTFRSATPLEGCQ